MKTAVLSVTLALISVGCGTDETLATCQEQAKNYQGDVEVAAAVPTTVQAVRNLQPGLQPPRWPDLSPDTHAVLCYLNGAFGDAPGGGRPYDRAVVAVAGENADLVILGYIQGMPVPSS